MLRSNRHHPNTSQPNPQPASYQRGLGSAGHQVAVFARQSHRVDEWRQELRVTVEGMEDGQLFASLRVWKQTPQTGEWWPTQAGVTVRLSEIQGVTEALTAVANLAKDPNIKTKIRDRTIQIGMELLGLPPR